MAVLQVDSKVGNAGAAAASMQGVGCRQQRAVPISVHPLARVTNPLSYPMPCSCSFSARANGAPSCFVMCLAGVATFHHSLLSELAQIDVRFRFQDHGNKDGHSFDWQYRCWDGRAVWLSWLATFPPVLVDLHKCAAGHETQSFGVVRPVARLS